jgi:tripartite-type tricarboxylate transporter receptor subunit TctC
MAGRRGILAATAGLLAAGSARAQERYPARPIRAIVPYAPGGATDIIARLVAEEMRRSLGQPVVVENRPGALGIIAIEAVARSRPDGYTLMIGNVTTNAITPVVFRGRLSLDYEATMMPVTQLANVPGVLCATTVNFPPTTVAAVVEHARQHPGQVHYVTAGVGSYTHFDHVLLARRGGAEMTHVPFTAGAGGFITGLLNGDVQIGFVNVATAGPLVAAGRLRGLAVTADTRLPELPDVPTMAEAGFAGIGTSGWNALFGPAGLPPEVVAALFRAATEAVASSAVQEAFRRQGIQPVPSASPEAAGSWLRSELELWRRIQEAAQIDVG